MYHSSKGNSTNKKGESKITTLFPRDFSESEKDILRELARDRLSFLQPEDEEDSEYIEED